MHRCQKLFNLLLVACLCLHFGNITAQPPIVQWQHAFGGSLGDAATNICATKDGGYILTAVSASGNGNLSGNYGLEDAWIFKLDSAGNIQWQRRFGGSRQDIATAIVSFNGGYVIAGYTASSDNGLNDKHGDNPTTDYLVIRLDNNGKLLWQKCLGGNDYDYAYGIDTTMDGGFIVTGMASSYDGDVTGDHGNGDSWMVKLNGDGGIVWQRSVGGMNPDVGNSVKTDRDGNYIVIGFSFSADSDVATNNRSGNIWLFKISTTGGMQWQRSFGGSLPDYGQQLLLTRDGGYAICGYAYSDIFGNHGGADYYLVKLSVNGDTEWEKCYGGKGSDLAQAFVQTADGGFLAAGYTFSSDGDVTSNHGTYDGWLLKVDASGKKQWDTSIGGSSNDRFKSILPTADGGYLLAGVTESPSSDINGIHGMEDAWVVKMGCEPVLPLIRITTGTPVVCKGGKTLFTSTTTYGGTAPAYQWKKNNRNVGTNHPVYEDSDLKDNDSVVCLLTSNNTCTTIQTVTSNTIVIKLNDPVVPKVTIQTLSTTVCKGSPVSFTARTAPSNSTNQFTWFVNNSSFNSFSDTFLHAGLQDGDRVFVKMISFGPCIVSLPVTSDTIKMNIVEAVLPSVTITASDTAVCKGDNIAFAATTSVTGNVIFEWMVNDVTAGYNTREFNSSQLSDNDRVSCRVTVNEGCASVSASNIITVHAGDIPVVVCMNDTAIAAGASIKLYANVSGNYSSALWTPAPNIQNNSSLNHAVISPAVTGVYRLTVLTPEGCSAYDEVKVTVHQKGIIPTAFSPNNDGINDSWRLPFMIDCSSCFVNIFDRYGIMVYSSRNYSKPWDGTMNNKPLPAGVYYYFLRKNNQEAPISGSITITR